MLACNQPLIETRLETIEELPIQPFLVDWASECVVEAAALFMVEDQHSIGGISLVQRPIAMDDHA